jgi:hypothetical protein
VIAEAVISLANLATTKPSAEGVMYPSTIAVFAVVAAEVAFEAAGRSNVSSPVFVVSDVVVKEYWLRYESLVGEVGPLIDQRDPVVVAAEV